MRVEAAQRFSSIFLLVVLLPVFGLAGAHSRDGSLLFYALFAALLVGMVATVFIPRIVVSETELTAYNELNRRTLSVPFDQISAYQKDDSGRWVLVIGEKQVRLPSIDSEAMHAIMAVRAPAALKGKRWVGTQVPPHEDFKRLSLFEPNRWLSKVLFTLVMASIFLGLVRVLAVAILFSRVHERLWELRKVLGRLSITSDGISEGWPWKEKSIRWEEVTAVFCDRRFIRRFFVIVSQDGTSITIPPHIAIELEVARKFFYSLPDGTRMVNFDDSYRKGYRRGGRRRRVDDRSKSRVPELQPIL